MKQLHLPACLPAAGHNFQQQQRQQQHTTGKSTSLVSKYYIGGFTVLQPLRHHPLSRNTSQMSLMTLQLDFRVVYRRAEVRSCARPQSTSHWHIVPRRGLLNKLLEALQPLGFAY